MSTTAAEKIVEAKRLLHQAAIQLRREARTAMHAELCDCGHRRDRHVPSTSINYTGGFCEAPRCKCKWFMQLEVAEREGR